MIYSLFVGQLLCEKLCCFFLVSPFKRIFKTCNRCKSKRGQWSYQLWRSVLIAAENQSLFTLDTWTVVGWSIIPTSYHFLISSVKRRQLQLLDDKVVRASLCNTAVLRYSKALTYTVYYTRCSTLN